MLHVDMSNYLRRLLFVLMNVLQASPNSSQTQVTQQQVLATP